MEKELRVPGSQRERGTVLQGWKLCKCRDTFALHSEGCCALWIPPVLLPRCHQHCLQQHFCLKAKVLQKVLFSRRWKEPSGAENYIFLVAASVLSRDHRCQEQGLARFGAQHQPRLACRGTIPKVGALALRLRSSDIPTTHTITRSPMERTQGNDKMKHRSDSDSQNTHDGGMASSPRLREQCQHGVNLST